MFGLCKGEKRERVSRQLIGALDLDFREAKIQPVARSGAKRSVARRVREHGAKPRAEGEARGEARSTERSGVLRARAAQSSGMAQRSEA